MTPSLPLLTVARVTLCCAALAPWAQAADRDVLFESKIRPLLVEHCQKCHGESKQENGLRLDSKAGWQKGGDHGTVIMPGDPQSSLLIKAVRRLDKDLQMPPKHALTPDQIAALEQWVKMGAPDPRSGNTIAKPGVDMVAARKHWAYQPVGHPEPPALKGDADSLQALDLFVAARRQQQGQQPNPPADRRTLIRRATFDLTGLPPTPAEINIFLTDTSPDPLGRLVDRLLASKAYG